jgi:hypothetical protein
MGQGPKESSAYTTADTSVSATKHLIVDTGASHVLFRQKQDSTNLSNIQMSARGDSPSAILKAANGALLDSIGRGMLTIGTVTVVAYIFQDADLVHNLLGIAPFADRGCKASFDASHFYLYHLDRTPILVGTRDAQNL